jgi:hypothetical protein
MSEKYSVAISKGVENWFEANKKSVLSTVEKRVSLVMEELARAIDRKVASFFDDNREEIISAVSAAIVYVLKSKNILPVEGKYDKDPG